MTEVEAGEFVVKLVAHYPGVKFTEQNAQSYQSLLVSLGREEAEAARVELAETSKFIPSFAEIREVVMRNRRLAGRVQSARALRLPEGNSKPSPGEWGAGLSRLLDSSERHQRMAAAWYASHGKKAPPDPAEGIIELVRSGAAGEDVRYRVRKTVIPPAPPESVEEFEELERRYP